MANGGSIWQAAKRGEGYQLARESNITWVIVIIGGFLHFWFRYFSGKPLLGDEHRKTNATWSRPGTTIYYEGRPTTRPPFGWNNGNPMWYCWSAMTERRRALIRILFFVLIITSSWIWWNNGTPYTASVWSAFVMSFVLLPTHGLLLNTYLDWRHRRQIIKPLEETIAPILGKTAAETVIRMPRRKAS